MTHYPMRVMEFTDKETARLYMRVWERAGEDADGCWPWQGSMGATGYGYLGTTLRGRDARLTASRLSYTLFKGPIPDGLQIDHLCRKPACVNPDHLEAVTARVNSHRSNSITGVNARKTHCKRGHEFTPENTFTQRKGSRICRICKLQTQRARTAALVDGLKVCREALEAIRDSPLPAHQDEVFADGMDANSPAARLMLWADLTQEVARNALAESDQVREGA